jgi:hypothetical protein
MLIVAPNSPYPTALLSSRLLSVALTSLLFSLSLSLPFTSPHIYCPHFTSLLFSLSVSSFYLPPHLLPSPHLSSVLSLSLFLLPPLTSTALTSPLFSLLSLSCVPDRSRAKRGGQERGPGTHTPRSCGLRQQVRGEVRTEQERRDRTGEERKEQERRGEERRGEERRGEERTGEERRGE